jgi:hypothetical protein
MPCLTLGAAARGRVPPRHRDRDLPLKQFLVTLRRQPAPLAGTFIAPLLAAVLAAVTACLTGTGLTLTVPAR